MVKLAVICGLLLAFPLLSQAAGGVECDFFPRQDNFDFMNYDIKISLPKQVNPDILKKPGSIMIAQDGVESSTPEYDYYQAIKSDDGKEITIIPLRKPQDPYSQFPRVMTYDAKYRIVFSSELKNALGQDILPVEFNTIKAPHPLSLIAVSFGSFTPDSVPVDIESIRVSFDNPVNTEPESRFYLQNLASGEKLEMTAEHQPDSDEIILHIPQDQTLKYDTEYSIVFPGNIKDINGNCFDPSTARAMTRFKTAYDPSLPVPEVSGSQPADRAANVPVDTEIRIGFNRSMDPGSLNSIRINGGAVPFDGQYDALSSTYILKPVFNLNYGSLYRVTVPATVKDSEGYRMRSSREITFSTRQPDITPPIVTETDPPNGAKDVKGDQVIRVTFSEDMDPGSFGDIECTDSGQSGFPITKTYDAQTFTLSVSPSSGKPWAEATTYIIEIPGTVKDKNGRKLVQPLSVAFSTPGAGRTNASVITGSGNLTGAAELSETMDGKQVRELKLTVADTKANDIIKGVPGQKEFYVEFPKDSPRFIAEIPISSWAEIYARSGSFATRAPGARLTIPARLLNLGWMGQTGGGCVRIIIGKKPSAPSGEQDGLIPLNRFVEMRMELTDPGVSPVFEWSKENLPSGEVALSEEDTDKIVDLRCVGLYSHDGFKWNYEYSRPRSRKVEFWLANWGFFQIAEYRASFKDIKNHWARNEIRLMAARHVIAGRGDGGFEPDRGITRAEYITMLYYALRLKPVIREDASFTDVGPDDWYYPYVKTGVALGLVCGYPDNTFRPEQKVSRAEMAAILVKAVNLARPDYSPERTDPGILDRFKDKGKAPVWARQNIAAAVDLGLLTGKKPSELAPLNRFTRAEAASCLKRFLVLIDYI